MSSVYVEFIKNTPFVGTLVVETISEVFGEHGTRLVLGTEEDYSLVIELNVVKEHKEGAQNSRFIRKDLLEQIRTGKSTNQICNNYGTLINCTKSHGAYRTLNRRPNFQE